jgi:FG-GAP repeat
MSLRLVVLACAVLSVGLQAQFPLSHDIVGQQSGASFGAALSPAGDLDGDGLQDLVVGAPGFNGPGAVAVFSGCNPVPLRLHFGLSFGEDFGWAVAGLGDFDGDGVGDYAVGAPFAFGASGLTGRVDVFSGIDGSLIVTLEGEGADDRFGWALDAAEDVNGDGFADLVVGASHYDGSAGADQGRAYVFLGPVGALYRTIDGESAGDLFGSAVSGAGDRDGDMRGELVIGARWSNGIGPTNVGRAYVYDPFDQLITLVLEGEIGGDQFGIAVDGGSDVDGDGVPDLLIGAMQNDFYANGVPQANIGRAYVYSGATDALLHTFYGELAQDHLGASVALLDDLNGDGHADIALGGLTFPLGPGTGILRVHSGADGSELLRRVGDAPGDFYGYALARLGDTDGDGVPEFAVGVVNDADDAGVPDLGRVEILRMAGARRYESQSGLMSGLDATWNGAFFPGSTTTGLITVSGGTPFGFGVAAVSLAADDFSAGPFDVLIDISPSQLLLTSNFGFDATGALYTQVDLHQPALANSSLFVQFLATGSPLLASPAFELHFTP